MGNNAIPESYKALIKQLVNAADGALAYGIAIGLVHNTEDKIRADYVALVGKSAGPGGVPPAQPGLKALWTAAQQKQVDLTADFTGVCATGRILARTCIHSLMPVLGERWNSKWTSAGFSGSLAVPNNPLTMLQQLRAYFFTNPTRETPSIQGIVCTAVACEAAAQAITAADHARNQGDTDGGIAYGNFLNGMAAGRARLTGLRTELDQLISDDDDRWYAFGFEKPSDPTTPAVPTALTVTAGAPGSKTLLANWALPRRADNFRVCAVLKSNGSEVANDISQDTQFTLTLATVATGAVVVLTVTARNDAGESPASDPVEIAVP